MSQEQTYKKVAYGMCKREGWQIGDAEGALARTYIVSVVLPTRQVSFSSYAQAADYLAGYGEAMHHFRKQEV